MTGFWRNRKAFLVVALVLVGAAAAVSVSLAYPTPVPSPQLGADWQCHRSVGIVTTCRRVSHGAPTNHRRPLQAVNLQQA
jgi:hypothetical protein